jgi:hypothetical protein
MGTADAFGQYGKGIIVNTPVVRTFDTGNNGERLIPEDASRDYFAFIVKPTASDIKYTLYEATRFFAAVDPILRGLVPSSRRHNTYCKPLEKVTRLGGECPNTLLEVIRATSERYCGINLKALEAHGTIEFRYHGGTVQSDKIIHWARLCERVVNVALSNKAASEADALIEVVNGKNRLEMLIALLGLPEDTAKYLMGRHSAFMGSDARHAIKYITDKKRAAARSAVNA